MRLNVLDLCCGLGGWSNVWREQGHYVCGVDIVKPADMVCDVKILHPGKTRWDVIFASPPCTEFSREEMPWRKTGKIPDLSIVAACIEIARIAKPRFFVLENVRGAQKYLGKCIRKHGSRYLWGVLPECVKVDSYYCYGKWHVSPGLERARIRSKIPEKMALAYYEAIVKIMKG